MMIPRPARRFRPQFVLLSILFSCLLVSTFWLHQRSPRPSGVDEAALRNQYPLAYTHIHSFEGKGGAWFIPPEWLDKHARPPRNIVEAAQIASEAARSHRDRNIPYSNIPLIVHQKWNSARLNGTKAKIVSYVEDWLTASISPPAGSKPMAYFLWDDEGVSSLVETYEKPLLDDFKEVFSPVEKVDIFRIMACKWFGGIYGDIDTRPLHHPMEWIRRSDITAWTDEVTGRTYGLNETVMRGLERASTSSQPVNAIWGIECDTDPETDAHWRMGYTFAVQLTNWALASAPHHPILQKFLDTMVQSAADAREAALHTAGGRLSELHFDPLVRTGPVAVTEATSSWLEEHEGLRWNAMTGLKDNGRNKLAGDVLILPITGFSPTTEKNSRMGEKTLSHPDARLTHTGLGSWHHTNLKVEVGKFCRKYFGMCKDWEKMW